MKNWILVAAAMLLACSSNREAPVSHEGTTLTDCFVPVPTGNVVGLGFNAQPRNWGSDGRAVKPALDLLVNDLGATFARVEVNAGSTDWESTNDDSDAAHFNWTSYDAIFSTKSFRDLFAYVNYLNQLGVAHVELAQHGGLPAWMGTVWPYDGRAHTLSASQEDEFVETSVAMLVYARTRAPEPRPHFDLFSPFNEPEYSPPEGVSFGTTNPQIQEARVVRKLVDRMNAIPELAGIQLVVGEHANVEGMVGDRSTLLVDPVIAARLAATSFHRYDDAVATSWSGSNPPVFLSEFNAPSPGGNCFTTTWAMAMQATGNLISALQGGVTAGLAWSDFDAPHVHQFDEFQTWGLLATHSGSLSESGLCGHFNNTQPADSVLDAMTYTPKPTYWALRHAMHWIRANASPITMSATGGVLAVAYRNADNTVAVFGRTNSATSSTVTLTMQNPPSYLTPRISVSGSYDQVGAAVPMTSGQGTFSLPGSSVFTLLSSPGDSSGGSGGQSGMGAGGAASGAGGQSAGSGGVAGDSAGMSGGSGAPSGGQSGSSAGGQSGAGGMTTGGAGQGGAGMSSVGAGAGGAGAAGSGGSGPVLVAGWAFNEGSGATTADASGHGHTGTINGATWVTTGCKFGDCLSFAGTSGKNVTVPTATDLNLGTAFTIMAWVKPTTTSGWRPVLIKEAGTNLEAYLLYSDPVTQGAYFTDSSNAERSVTGGSHVSTSAWSHVAMVRNGTSLTYWVNGSQVASTTVSSLPVVTSTGILAIGGHTFWSGEWYSGMLDDIRVESGAETQAGIQAAMGAGL
jgi:hypothetical protein